MASKLSNWEMIYKERVRFFERPFCSNTNYTYSLASVWSPHDFTVKLVDDVGAGFEERLGKILKEHGDKMNAKDKKGDAMVIDQELLYVGMPILLKRGGGEGAASSIARAEVVSFEGKKVEALLVDDGGVLTAMLEEIIPVTESILRIPKLGIQCRLATIEPEAEEWPTHINYKQHFTGKSQVITFVDYYANGGGVYEVVLEVDGVNVATKFFHDSLCRPVALPLLRKTGKPNLNKEVYGQLTFSVSDYTSWVGLKAVVFGVRVFRDETDDDGRMKCVLQMQPEVVNAVQDLIAEHIDKATKEVKNQPFPKEPGVLCLAKFGEAEYFRAIILKKLDGQRMLVDYVDYKEHAVVAADDLIKLPSTLLGFPEGAVVCQMTDFLTSPCPDEKKLAEMVENKDLYAIVDACDSVLFGQELLVSLFEPVDFTGPDKSFGDIFGITERPVLIKEVLQLMDPVTKVDELFMHPRLPDPQKIYPGAMISVINSWDSLWVQLSEEIDMAERLSLELTQFYENGGCNEETKKEFLASVTSGRYVAAQQADEEENAWYRARVVEVTGEKLMLLYIDYGNSEWVAKNDVYPLHKYFAKDHVMSFEIALKQPVM